jgi:hypothetical protein
MLWKNWKSVMGIVGLLIASPALVLGFPMTVMQEDGPEFGGAFDTLNQEQQRLVVEWVDKFNAMFDQRHTPEDVCFRLGLSRRTTYEAVTHALYTSELTTKDGSSLGNALELVREVEAIKGRVPRSRGDLQFRMYVLLKPGVMETLKKSQEFRRSHDNTVYHKGYPICFRQSGGVPSIQFSISRDEKRADIDVDYRSSKFPAALVNGHLTAANSDVTSGNNHERHVNRWTGLENWWRNWFGLPLIQEPNLGTVEEAGEIPDVPRKGRAKIHEAVNDFWTSWLVEKSPAQSIAYFSDQSMRCVGVDDEGETLGHAFAKMKLFRDMAAASDAMGPIGDIGEVVTGVRFPTRYARVVEQPYHRKFVLYEVDTKRAEEVTCDNQDVLQGSDLTTTNLRFGKYYASILFFKAPDTDIRGETIYLLWGKEAGNWKILAFFSVPAEGEVDLDTRGAAAVAASTLQSMDGDPAFIKANAAFLDSWLVSRDVDKAFGYVSPKSYSCVNLYLQEGETRKDTEEEKAKRLREGLGRMDQIVGRGSLDKLLSPVEFVHPDMRVVPHSQEAVFALGVVPDQIGDVFECSDVVSDQEPVLPEDLTYGNYYATSFQFELAEGEGGQVLQLLWAKESSQWKVIAYRVILP